MLSALPQLTVSLSAAQLLPAAAGALTGIAGGYVLFTAANQGASASQPPAWWLITAVLSTLIAVAGLTAVPARLAARLPIAGKAQLDRDLFCANEHVGEVVSKSPRRWRRVQGT